MPKKSAIKPKPASTSKAPDPTTDAALLLLAPAYASPPDIPVDVAKLEIASLARLARARSKELGRVGIGAHQIDTLARFATRLAALETTWQRARGAVKLSSADRKKLQEGEALDAKLLAGGRWACRNDDAAHAELNRIAEGSGLADTVQDLRDLVTFWKEHAGDLARTDITASDLARATELANVLSPSVEKEASDLDAASALELRNRVFWAADELAKEVREGGRYAFRLQPKIAAKFVSRYRATVVRRSKSKAKNKPAANAPVIMANGA